jgi:ATP-dependent RNA helicase DeaD
MSQPLAFADPALDLPDALRRTLAARGYETAMPVQAAILAAPARGRDLLVSSPTGSGKTIAFGAALTETLLAAPPRAAAAGKAPAPPRALVVVPTRELAIQVREELGWLLAQTGWRLASFTGGTAVSGDLRALRRGVDIAIGTPGRLCDLLRRETLSLGGLAAVVLDEADEMLDLGFREDLETLLGAAPAARRTLMFSATLPAPIRALAKRFQRDALAIDPRRPARAPHAPGDPPSREPLGGGTAAPAHEDITFVAHLIAGDDRLAAVINVLRASGAGRSIVFCTTRDAVGGLHRELVSRGFSATAISGERAQAERDRALDQVRQGEASVLVATNVAARGLHLPDVDLIIHADLPLNVESLTHRSGRTGRAGRKGTAVVIASLAERRKAERLLAMARIPALWTPPPSAPAIAAAARARLGDELAAEPGSETEGAGTVPAQDVDDLLVGLQQRVPLDQLARRLLARELARLPVGEKLLPVPLPTAAGGRKGTGFGGHQPPVRRPAQGDFAREGVLFRVNLGAQNQADPRWLLPLICRRGGVTRREVGAIRVGARETLFEISGEAAGDFALAASQGDPRAPNVRVERVERGGGRPRG